MTEIDFAYSDLEPEEIAILMAKQREEMKARRLPRPTGYSANAVRGWQRDIKEHSLPIHCME